MFLPVIRSDVIADIVHRAAEQFQILQKLRSSECQVEIHRSAFECIVCLRGLYIYGSLLRCQFKRCMPLFLYQQSEIQKSVRYRILALCRNDVLSFLESSDSFVRNPYHFVLVAHCSCIMYFYSV